MKKQTTEKNYILLKTYESPTGKIHPGVLKTESQWIYIFPRLIKGDCEIKTDWFVLETAKVKIKFMELIGYEHNSCILKDSEIPFTSVEILKIEEVLNIN